MNNQNPAANFSLNLEEFFPKPPFHYKQENLLPPNLEFISKNINPEYYSLGKKFKVF